MLGSRTRINELENALSALEQKYQLLSAQFTNNHNILQDKDKDLADWRIRFEGIVSKNEQENSELVSKYGELLKDQNFRLGKSGIELTMQDKLAGKPGVTEIEVDSRGRAIKEISFMRDERGNDLKLTIDINIQNIGGSKIDTRREDSDVAEDRIHCSSSFGRTEHCRHVLA